MISLFKDITPDNKSKLLKILETSNFTYQRGVNIAYLFKDKESIGLVIDGSLDIIRIDYNGTRTIIETIYEDEILGTSLTSLLSNDYEIITREDTKILWLDYKVILGINDIKYTYYNQFIKNLLMIALEKNTLKNERIEILTQKTIRNKLLEYFRIEALKNRSKIIYLKSTWQDLADYLAIDRCAMTRELKNLKEEGFVSVKGRVITLLYSF